MSLSSTTARVAYTGNNSTKVYSYGCRIFAETDLLVTVRLIATGAETLLVNTTDYTVDSVGKSLGNITLVNASQAWLTSGNLLSTYRIVIRRVRPMTQPSSFRNQSTFYGSTHEDQFDSDAMVRMQLLDVLNRAVILPETFTNADFNPILPPGIIGVPGVTFATDNITGTTFVPGPTVTAIAGAQAQAIAAAASAVAAAASAATAALGAAQITGTRASPSSIVAGAGVAFSSTSFNNIWFIKGSGGAVTVSANPQIAAGSSVGQRLLLIGRDNTNTVTFSDGTGLDLDGPITLGAGASIELFWDGTNWSEIGRTQR